MNATDNEIRDKQARLAQFLDRHNLDGVLLQQRANFAWITAGRDNHIANNTPLGVAAILATRDSRVCLANAIEAPRFQNEELAGTGIDVVSYPWHDRAAGQNVVRELVAGRRIAADHDDTGAGFQPLPSDFAELRYSLGQEEIARYRECCQRAARALEDVCFDISPGDNEHDIAGAMDDYLHRAGLNPLVTLVATDERINRYRHPIPIDKKLERHAMLVTCAEFGGLIACLTRIVHFGQLPDDLRRRHQAVVNVDAALNLATRPGKTLGQLFDTLAQAYADNGFPDEYKLHHQGGPTGYQTREAIAVPGSPVTVHMNQAFAWNPSITGTKSEDTVLVAEQGLELLTSPSDNWPKIEAKGDFGTLPRPDILVR